MKKLKREICFRENDFDPFLEAAGIDPTTVTEHEWNKYTDAFCEGTFWAEVAMEACNVIILLREEENA